MSDTQLSSPSKDDIKEFIMERKDDFPILFKLHLDEHQDPECYHCIAIKEAYK